MNKLSLTDLLSVGPVITDGAWGTELQARGLSPGASPEIHGADHPEAPRAVARAYLDSGSAIILTNSFGGNRLTLKKHGAEDRVRELNLAAARSSVEEAGDKARVFGSIGPTGTMVMMGDISVGELEEVFAEQTRALAEGGVHGIVVETMAELDELRAALRGARSTGLPVAACMTFDSGPEKDRTMMGVSVEDAAQAMEEEGADICGANCGLSVDRYLPICEAFRRVTDKPLWMKPNAGMPEVEDGRTRYRMTPDHFASEAVRLVDAGARFIGGCCGTNPDSIAALAAELHRRGGGDV